MRNRARILIRGSHGFLGVACLMLAGAVGADESAAPDDAGPIDVTPMTQQRLEKIVGEIASEASGPPGWLRFVYDGVPMACVSDTNADRMRITAPIMQVKDASARQMLIAMEANFHSVLDARYATSQGLLHAVYLHPLSSLTEAQLRSAIQQVAVAHKTFGTAYSSGVYEFQGGVP